MNKNVQKIVVSAMFAALVCVATMVIRIPTPLKGYINIGDGIVLLAGWIIPPPYGAFAAGIGSMLSDLFAGYVIYVPVTFLIKGIMALAAWYGFGLISKRINKTAARILSGVAAQLVMVLGYFVFESVMYGIDASALNMPMNLLQSLFGIVISTILISVFEKNNIKMWH